MHGTAQESIITTPEAFPAPLIEDRQPLPGLHRWRRGDGAFSITYAPPLEEGVSVDKMFETLHQWLNECEANFRKYDKQAER